MRHPAPYARIVADVRAGIESGRLRPGDRVPSTREITRRWGVAMATATKALTALRHEGLVRAVPGVGTVVVGTVVLDDARPPGAAVRPPGAAVRPPGAAPSAAEVRLGPDTPPSGPQHAKPASAALRRDGGDQALAVDHIVAAAIAVADAEGLPAVSMRRVANEIGVATMSLYRHVADKDDLLLRMMDRAISEVSLPPERPAQLRSRLEVAARLLWSVFRRHSWLGPALSLTRPQLIPSGMAWGDWVLAALEDAGLTGAAAMTTYLTLVNYIRGTAVALESEAEAEAATGMNSDEWLADQEPALTATVEEQGLTTLRRYMSSTYDLGLDELFDFGLQRLLAGIDMLIPAREGVVRGRAG